MGEIDFKKVILEDRKKRKEKKRFKGTFLEYLEIVKQCPEVAMLAHERMYRQLLKEEYSFKKYRVFEERFFGIDSVIQKIVRYFRSAALQGEEARQVLYLVGPVGSGKSSIIDTLKSLLEESPPIYALADCPLREEPLHLIPYHLRPFFQKELGVWIEGDLCPICRYRLQEEWNEQYELFPIEEVSFSLQERKGISVVPPVDSNNQDTSVLIGSIDISKMDQFPEDDPRVFSFNGAFHTGNRGMVEFIEIFKNDVEYLHGIITATQEKQVPSPSRGPMLYFDGIIVAHSNEAEWKRFKGDYTNEAILDRIVKIEVPYCLELKEEVKIYEKMLKKSRFQTHIGPHTLEMASMFAILTRLQTSTKVDLLTKIKVYNGETVFDPSTNQKIDMEVLKEEKRKEGMSGVSTRFIIKALNNALADAQYHCIHPFSMIESIKNSIMELDEGEEIKQKYMDFIEILLKKEYHRILQEEMIRFFMISYEEQVEELFHHYLDEAEAYLIEIENQEKKYEESFLQSVEEQIGIIGSSAKGFRKDVVSYVYDAMKEGKRIDYTSYEPLQKAIEKKMFYIAKEFIRCSTRTGIRNEKHLEKYQQTVEVMKKNGYCQHCCDVILDYVGNELWKE